jgi:uncharacterized Fe-S radical SAM superfamily protein PflX
MPSKNEEVCHEEKKQPHKNRDSVAFSLWEQSPNVCTPAILKVVSLCPKLCRVDRKRGRRGFCRESAEMRIAFAGIHLGQQLHV